MLLAMKQHNGQISCRQDGYLFVVHHKSASKVPTDGTAIEYMITGMLGTHPKGLVVEPVTPDHVLTEHKGFECAGSMCQTTASSPVLGFLTPGRVESLIPVADNVNVGWGARSLHGKPLASSTSSGGNGAPQGSPMSLKSTRQNGRSSSPTGGHEPPPKPKRRSTKMTAIDIDCAKAEAAPYNLLLDLAANHLIARFPEHHATLKSQEEWPLIESFVADCMAHHKVGGTWVRWLSTEDQTKHIGGIEQLLLEGLSNDLYAFYAQKLCRPRSYKKEPLP